MHTVFNRLLVFFFIGLMFTGANAQYRHNVPTTRIKDTMAQSQGSSLSSLFSFSLGMASMGGFATSYGTYTNNLNYLINDKWSLTSRIDLIQPTLSSPTPQGVNAVNPMVFYGAQLEYKASNNLSFSLSMDNHPRYQRQWGLSPYSLYAFPPR